MASEKRFYTDDWRYSVSESYDEVIREYISFVNNQGAVYMDALAGFAGHHVRVERQIHRVLRPSGIRTNEKGEKVIVHVSYEDPTKPDIILDHTISAADHVATNAPGGSNEQWLAWAIAIFLFTYWEDTVRPRLAKAQGVRLNEIHSDIMGDMRILRHAVLHAKSVIHPKEHRRLKLLGNMFPANQTIHISYENMHRLCVLIKQDCARLMFELGVKDAPISPEEIRDIAIQRGNRGDKVV